MVEWRRTVNPLQRNTVGSSPTLPTEPTNSMAMEEKFIDFTEEELKYYDETDFKDRICAGAGGFLVNILKYEDGTYLVMFAISIPHYHCKVFPTEQVIRDYVRKESPDDYEKYAMEGELTFGNWIIPEDAIVEVYPDRRYIKIKSKKRVIKWKKE